MKRTSYLFLAGLLVIFFGCRNTENSQISGDLKSSDHNLEGKMVYLINLNDSGKPSDSAVVTSGKFEFKMKAVRNNLPVRMAIQYFDESRGRYLRKVGYVNPFFENVLESQFYFNGSRVQLELDLERQNKLINEEIVFRIKHMDDQTDVAFQHHQFKKGPGGHRHNLKLIKENANSVDLVYQLWSVKEHFSKEEVQEMVNSFDASVKRSVDYLNLVLYLNDPFVEENVGEVKYIFVND